MNMLTTLQGYSHNLAISALDIIRRPYPWHCEARLGSKRIVKSTNADSCCVKCPTLKRAGGCGSWKKLVMYSHKSFKIPDSTKMIHALVLLNKDYVFTPVIELRILDRESAYLAVPSPPRFLGKSSPADAERRNKGAVAMLGSEVVLCLELPVSRW